MTSAQSTSNVPPAPQSTPSTSAKGKGPATTEADVFNYMDVIAPNIDVHVFLKGLPIEMAQFNTDAKREVFAHLSLHCVLNGPVGVGKETTFPPLFPLGAELRGSISTLLEIKTLTNGEWRATCMKVAIHIKSAPNFIPLISSCQTRLINGDLWPLAVQKVKQR